KHPPGFGTPESNAYTCEKDSRNKQDFKGFTGSAKFWKMNGPYRAGYDLYLKLRLVLVELVLDLTQEPVLDFAVGYFRLIGAPWTNTAPMSPAGAKAGNTQHGPVHGDLRFPVRHPSDLNEEVI